MALTTPTLLTQVAFDATQQQTFYFNVTGTSAQIVSNTLIIRENDTNTIVYQENQETFKYEHVVNANELTNGKYYNAVVAVLDSEGNQSSYSIPIQFWCYTTPTISIVNIPSNKIITNASFNFQFTYNQNENEAINSYVVNLFNSSQVQISTSGIQYATKGTPPYSGSYMFTGFENSTVYYIEVIATTIEGTVISTGMQQFTVQYTRPDLFTLVELTNNCNEGYISIASNIVSIEGSSNPDPPIYINDSEVDLTGFGDWVIWDNGFYIENNMLSRIWFRNPNNYTTLVQFSNIAGDSMRLNFMLGYQDLNSTELQAYVELYVFSSDEAQYYIYSNYVDILPSTEYYTVYLTRINNIYSLQLLTN